jgi:hypothetical protein
MLDQYGISPLTGCAVKQPWINIKDFLHVTAVIS